MSASDAENIYHAWDKALATIESPLISHLLEKQTGILKGKNELRLLIKKVAERKPNIPPLKNNYRVLLLSE